MLGLTGHEVEDVHGSCRRGRWRLWPGLDDACGCVGLVSGSAQVRLAVEDAGGLEGGRCSLLGAWNRM